MNPFDFFEQKVCLTLVDEEWCAAQTEFARVGLDGYEKFMALPDIGPHQSFNRSTRQILTNFMRSDHRTLLFLEDDAEFRDVDHLAEALSELPADWDIVYLGANLICCPTPPERYSEHLFKVKGAWTTHAIGYHKKIVPLLLDGQPGFSEEMYDNWMSRQLPMLNAFCIAPMVAWQRPHVSSIWGRFDDYTGIFEASNQLLV